MQASKQMLPIEPGHSLISQFNHVGINSNLLCKLFDVVVVEVNMYVELNLNGFLCVCLSLGMANAV